MSTAQTQVLNYIDELTIYFHTIVQISHFL